MELVLATTLGSLLALHPVPSGTYEGYSAITRAPFGRIDVARARRLLPRWLRVRTRGNVSEVLALPEGRIRMTLRYGRRGLEEKRVWVDGASWIRSVFRYDRFGRAATKEVTGPGVRGTLRYQYGSDARARIRERVQVGVPERWEVSYGAAEITASMRLKGKLLRRDVFDGQGRLLRSDFGGAPAAVVRLRYVRDGRGRLARVERTLPGRQPQAAAAPGARDPALTADMLAPLLAPVVERHEVLLALGEPLRHSVTGRGPRRKVRDGYWKKCLLNQASEVGYDAADRVIRGHVTCVCGFCVDARVRVRGRQVLGTDVHWTRGPWVRLDGVLDLTADHRVLTPRGPVPAGRLRAGDAVRGARGGVRRLRSVVVLPLGPARKGLNLRTASGTFTARGFVLESERGRPCPVADPVGAKVPTSGRAR